MPEDDDLNKVQDAGPFNETENFNLESLEIPNERFLFIGTLNPSYLKKVIDFTNCLEQSPQIMLLPDSAILEQISHYREYVKNEATAELNKVVDEYIHDELNIEGAQKLANTFGAKMGFDKWFRLRDILKAFGKSGSSAHDEFRSKLNLLVKFGFVEADPTMPNSVWKIVIDFDKRMLEINNASLAYMGELFNNIQTATNLLDKESRKEALNKFIENFEQQYLNHIKLFKDVNGLNEAESVEDTPSEG